LPYQHALPLAGRFAVRLGAALALAGMGFMGAEGIGEKGGALAMEEVPSSRSCWLSL